MRRDAGGGEECTGHNEVVLSVCLHQEESTCCGLEMYCGGKNECSSTETLFIFSAFLISKVIKIFQFWAFFLLITFFFTTVFVTSGHTAVNSMFEGAFPLHMFISSFHSLSSCPSNNEVVVMKLCLKKRS